MKKLLVIALAAFAMVACVNEEVTELPQGDAIAFESAFIDNATRAAEAVDPSTTTATLDGFNVWGFVKEHDGVIFNGTEVKKSNNGVWGYDGTQYWVPNQPYYFAALAPMNSVNVKNLVLATDDAAKLGLGSFKFTNVNGGEDLLYAKEMMTSKGLNEPNGAVKFQFQHLLSKVKFTFKNGFPTETASIKVTNVKMTAPAEAKINLAQADYAKAWTDHANTTTLEFGEVEKLANTQSAEVANERLTIPAAASQTYTITFDVELFMGAQSVYEVSKTSTVTGYELEMGKAYNFTAEINPDNLDLEEIVFDVEAVEGWEPQGGQVVDVAAAELKAAFENGGSYNLYTNVAVAEPLVLAQGKTLNLNLNGYTINAGLKQEGRHHYAIDNYGTMTIEGNGAINARGVENFGTMTINGDVTITNVDTNGGSAIWNEGNLTINAGTYTTNAGAGEGSYGSALNTQEGGVAVINGGTFEAYSQLTYAILNYGTTTINDANVKGKHGAVASAEGCETVIYGGSFELMSNPAVSDHCAYYVSAIYGGQFTLGENTDSGAQVFYESTIADGYAAVNVGGWYKVVEGTLATNAAELQAALNNAEVSVIQLVEGNVYDAVIVAKSNKTIEGNGAEVKCINLYGADNLTIKNVKFDANKSVVAYDGNGNSRFYASIISGDNTNKAIKGAHNLVIDGCTFVGNFANGGTTIAFNDQSRPSGGSGNITIKNCTFENTGAYCHIYTYYAGDSTNGHGNFVIENNTFTSATLDKPIYLGKYASNVPVVVTGNTFESVTSQAGAIYVQDHSSYGVSVNASNNTYAE